MEYKRAVQYLNINRNLLINPFILGGLTGGILGNFSLGLIVSGLTVLIWGFSAGMNFIALTTILLVLLTGNINLELIFIFVLSLAYLIRSGKLKGGYWLLAIPVLLTYPFWKLVLGYIPAGLLNDFNVSGQLLLIVGLALTLIRGRCSGDLLEMRHFFLKLLTIFLAIEGSWLTIPCWLGGSLLLPVLKNKDLLPSLAFREILITLAILLAGFLLLPARLSLAALMGLSFISLVSWSGWPGEKIPLLEMVYLAVITGILGSRINLFC